MPPASTIAALQKLYKTIYLGRDLSNQSKVRTPAFDQCAKFDDFYGEQLVFPFNQSQPTGISTTKTQSRTDVKPSKFDRWVMSARKSLFGTLTISSEAMFASKKDIGAWLRLRQKEQDEIMDQMKMVLGGHAFWGDGAGDIGQTSGIAGPAGARTSFTLVQPRDAVKFHIGMRLQFNPNRTGNAGTLRTEVAEVTAINRVTGLITMVNVVAGGGSNLVDADFVYQRGTYDALPYGISAFIPAADPTTVLLGMTRTDDPVMKGGWRVAWQGSIEESAKLLVALMGQYFNRQSSVLWLSRYNWFRLEQELTAQGRKVIDARATQVFGSPALLLLSPEGDIPVVADPYCPDTAGFLLDMSQIEVHHMEPYIHVIDDDGLVALRMNDDDGIEIQLRSYSENIVQRPYRCGRIAIT